MRYKNNLRLLTLGFVATCVQKTYAKCGNVDYSWGSDALADAHDYIVTMMLYVLFLRFEVIQEHTKLNIQALALPYK